MLFVNSKANAGPWTIQKGAKPITIPAAKAVSTVFSNSSNTTVVSRLFTTNDAFGIVVPVTLDKIKDQGSEQIGFWGEFADGENAVRNSKQLKDQGSESEETRLERFPFHEATSELYNPSLVRLLDPEIINKSGIYDTNFVTYSNEVGDKIGVAADLNGPNSALKKIWQTLIPDNEKKILEDYKKKTSLAGILTTASTDTFKDLIGDKIKGYGELVPEPLIGKAVGSFAKNTFKAAFDSIVLGPKKRDEELRKNRENLQKLAEILSQKNQNVGSISRSDIREYRTTPIIRNFTIGEDSVIIPYYGNTPPQISIIKDSAFAQNRGVSISTGSNTSEPNKIVNIILSDKSEQELSQAQVSAADYIAQLLVQREGDNSWVLDRNIPTLFTQTTLNHTSGPASTAIQVSRKEGRLPLSERMLTTTLSGNDQIFGTDGNEYIMTQAGDDLIQPGLGNDTVNGGLDTDSVFYVNIRRPVEIASNTRKDDNGFYAELTSTLVADENNSGSLNSTLINIENIHAFGGSNVDFSSLPNPVSDDYQYYSATLGAGSTFEGSSYDDTLLISFDSAYNNQNIDPFSLSTNADGGAGFDRILADFSGSTQRLSTTQVDGLTLITNEDDDIVLSYSNFENVDITGSDMDDLFLLDDSDLIDDIFCDIQGGQGDDVIDIQNLKIGKSSQITLNGDEGDDIIIGNANNNQLYGGGGDDKITGGGGRDIINGGAGSDLLVGGRGRDKFVILADGGTNTIKDFDLDREKIVLEGYNGEITDLDISTYPDSGSNKNTLISDGNSLQIVLMNVDSADLINSDRSLDRIFII